MSDTKISNFLQVDGGDISNITAIAAVGTASGGATGQNVKISGDELETSLELDVTQLTKNIGANDQVLKIVAGAPAWAASTDDDTTYTIGVPAATTDVQLLGSDASDTEVTFTGGDVIGITRTSVTELTVDHDDVTRTDTTSTLSPVAGGTFTCIDSVTTSTEGHITAANVKTVTLPAGGGGADAFNSLTVNATTREATWTYATDGANIKLTPLDPVTAPTPGTRTKIVLGDTFPDGAAGYLLVDPSNTNNFELPSNSLISGGAPEAFSAGLTRYTYVYDGTNFWWTREQAMVTPTYLPVGLITDQQIGFWDPATFTQYTFDNTYSVNVVNNLSTWSNSENLPAPLGDLQARVDETDPQYDNYMGWIAAAGSEPAYFDFRPDESFTSDDKYFTSTLNPDLGSSSNTDVTEWSWFGWIKSTSDLPNTDMWLVDGYNGSTYDEGVKFKNKRIGFYQGTSSTGTPDYTNFPAFDATGYEDKWTYVCVTITNTGNATAEGQATLYLGNETTFAAAGGTVTGYDGSNINIEGNGLYKFTFPAETFDDDAITSFFVGSNGSSSASGSSKPLYGMYLGEIGFYEKPLTDSEVGQNFNITRLTYGIS